MAENKPQTIMEVYRPPLAEFFATTMFVWCGCGCAVAVQAIPVLNTNTTIVQDTSLLTTISLAFGLSIATLVYAIAPISGGHINPAVTFAFVICGKMPIVTGIRYMVAQCLGAILGAAIVWGYSASNILTSSTCTHICMMDGMFVSSFYFVT